MKSAHYWCHGRPPWGVKHLEIWWLHVRFLTFGAKWPKVAKAALQFTAFLAPAEDRLLGRGTPKLSESPTVGGQNFCPAGKTLGKPRLQILRLCLNVGCNGKPSRRFAIRLGSPGRQTVAQLFCEAA